MRKSLTRNDYRSNPKHEKLTRPADTRWPLVHSLESRLCLSAVFTTPEFVAGIDSTTGIAAADFNGDGKTDIVVAGDSAGTSNAVVAVYLNQNGSFSTPTLIPISGTTAGITTGDFLGNGHQDIAVVDASTNQLDVFLNDSAGNFSQGAGASLGGTSARQCDRNG